MLVARCGGVERRVHQKRTRFMTRALMHPRLFPRPPHSPAAARAGRPRSSLQGTPRTLRLARDGRERHTGRLPTKRLDSAHWLARVPADDAPLDDGPWLWSGDAPHQCPGEMRSEAIEPTHASNTSPSGIQLRDSSAPRPPHPLARARATRRPTSSQPSCPSWTRPR